MSNKGPLITLLAGFAVAAGLVAANTQAGDAPGGEQVPAAQRATVATRAPAAPNAPNTPAATGPSGQPSATQTSAPPEAAPQPPPAPELEVTWAGKVDGGAATVAIVANGDLAVAYVCDGERLEVWLRGTAEGGRLALVGRGASLTATYDPLRPARAAGKIIVEGRTFLFDVAAVADPSGLYRATATVRGARVVAGWIVLADGTQVGLARVGSSVVRPSELDIASGRAAVAGAPVTAVPVEVGA